MLHKVLVIASTEESRGVAFELINHLKGDGYSVDLCHSPELDDVQLKADRALADGMGLDEYEGVVFIDDGGDAKTCIELAKLADGDDKVVAGHKIGCLVMARAGILEDKFVCKGLPKKAYEGAKVVNSTSVRCKNIVTSVDCCASGFAILILDALGGEVQRVITSATPEPLPAKAAMVVSTLGRWPEYWGLAERLAASGTALVVADWADIDLGARKVLRYMRLNPKEGAKLCCGEQSIPSRIWFKQTCIGANESVEAVEALERIGCVNANSSEAMRLAMDKVAVASLVGIGADVRVDVSRLMSPGRRWARSTSKGERRGAVKITGLGDMAVVTRVVGGRAKSKYVDAKSLERTLNAAFHGEFMVQPEAGSIRVGSKDFSLRFLMRRGPDGWGSSCEVARASDGTCCAARQVSWMAFGDEWHDRLVSAREAARGACVALQAMLSNPDGLAELGVDVVFDNGAPAVTGVTTTPDLTIVEQAAASKGQMMALAMSIGMEPHHEEPSCQEIADSRGGMSGFLGEDDGVQRMLVERELAHEGIWAQMDGQVAIQLSDGVEKKSFEDAIEILRGEAMAAARREMSAKDADPGELRRLKMSSRRARHRLFLLRALRKLAGAKRFASIYPSSVSGPYAHLDLPMSERVWEDKEGDDYLTDDKYVRNLPRYNPEYDEYGSGNSEYGFYLVWDEPRRSPEDWFRSLEGEGVYPTRSVLRH